MVVGGIICSADAFIYSNRALITELAARYRLPALYGIPGRAVEGGLIYYGPISSTRTARLPAASIGYSAAKSQQTCQSSKPNKLRMGINMKTAAALGLTVPRTLRASADEVIE